MTPYIKALPLVLVGIAILIHAMARFRGRHKRGNGRPAVACPFCGRKVQRGQPLQQHIESSHGEVLL